MVFNKILNVDTKLTTITEILFNIVRKNSDASDPVLRTNAPKSGFCP